MITNPHSSTPPTALPASTSSSSTSLTPTSTSNTLPLHPILGVPLHTDQQPLIVNNTRPPTIHQQQLQLLQQQRLLQQQQLTREQQQQQLELQQRLLQLQQQQAQLQLQNLQDRQKKQLLEDQKQRLQQQRILHQRPESTSISSPILVQTVPPPSTIVQPVFASGQSSNFPSLKLEQPLLLNNTTSTTTATTTNTSYPWFTQSYLSIAPTTATTGAIATVHTTSIRSNSPNLLRASAPTTASMDVMTIAPLPLHQHHSLSSNLLVLQQPMEPIVTMSTQEQQNHQQQQQQQQGCISHHQQLLQGLGPVNEYYHPLEYESSQGAPPSGPMNQGGLAYSSQNWTHPDSMMLNNSTLPFLSTGPQISQQPQEGIPSAYTSTTHTTMRTGTSFQQELSDYSIDARIIQKKDQMEGDSAGRGSNLVEEVRTGQQFLIKLQLTRKPGLYSSDAKYPTMRVDRREAINTAGEPRSDSEPLTLQIIVHLAKSGQVRKSACAKCCHKYGPSSPILVLLDPLSPSATDKFSYAHIDSSTGSVTVLAKVICSSTDHGERGNKDRYLFEFRLKRTSSMLAEKNGELKGNDADTATTCFTAPIMCSGHHKAKRAYPNQRPAKVTKERPVSKTKMIKRQRSVPSVTTMTNSRHISTDQIDDFLRSGSISSASSYPSPLSLMHDITSSSMVSNFGDDQSNDCDTGSNITPSQQLAVGMNDISYEPQSQPPRIFEVRPDRGPIRKTTDVALRGLFFQEGMVPYFGCFPAQDIIVETSNLILCKAPENPLAGTVPITLYDNTGNSFADLNQFTYIEDAETELLMLQLQLRVAHRALEYLHTQATGRRGDANDILKELPRLASSSGDNVLSNEDSKGNNSETALLTREQVEDSLLITLDQLPPSMDISFQLEDQGNMLHLSVLMGLDRLTMRLIEEGCELDALDAWAMTPLMYAVVKGNESVVRSLIIAGASSSGARTPAEFYSFLPRPVTPTTAITGYLTISCTRYSTTSRTFVASHSRGQPDMIKIENDEGSISTDNSSETEDLTTNSRQKSLPTIDKTQATKDDEDSLEQLAQRIRGVHLNHDMPPLDQQDLPPMHVIGSDGSITINNKVLKGDEIPRGIVPVDAIVTDNEESGYHSGVVSEVQDRLRLLHQAVLPSSGVEMTVDFKKLIPLAPFSTTLPPGPENLFRTGDAFLIVIQLATVPIPDSTQPPPTLPKEFMGIRFPPETVKFVSGRSTSILNEMTYILETSIELGQSAASATFPNRLHQVSTGDGIKLEGSCNSCSKYLNARVSQENSSVYPILQFSIPTEMIQLSETGTEGASIYNTGVIELKQGRVEVRARVNCSSLHHLIQREKAKHAAEMTTLSGTSSPVMDYKSLEDPGYVFHFRLIHPSLHHVVTCFTTWPILFQSYSRGRS